MEVRRLRRTALTAVAQATPREGDWFHQRSPAAPSGKAGRHRRFKGVIPAGRGKINWRSWRHAIGGCDAQLWSAQIVLMSIPGKELTWRRGERGGIKTNSSSSATSALSAVQ